MTKLIAGAIFTFVICLSCGGGGQKREIASNVQIMDSLRLLGERSFHGEGGILCRIRLCREQTIFCATKGEFTY